MSNAIISLKSTYTLLFEAVATSIFMASLLLAPSASAQVGGSGHVLYSPHQAGHRHFSAGYPRVIQLEHSGDANGTLLATFALDRRRDQSSVLPIYRSTDHGKTWSSMPISTIHATPEGWSIGSPTIFELPRAEGDLPAGTLLVSGTASHRGDRTQQRIEVFVSRDHGKSWHYRSDCAAYSHMNDRSGHGIWEPDFAIAGNGDLVCYFSDERPSVRGYNQVLAHTVSTDGGRTWGEEVYDVAIKDDISRPGMPTVVRLPNGHYAMTFEDCKLGPHSTLDPDETCSVYLKTSPDGLNWQPVSSLGSLVQTSDGEHFLHTPYIAWSPAGGKDGTLIVTGQRIVSGEDGHIKVIEDSSGKYLMTNGHLGQGPWQKIRAPFAIVPTGGYDGYKGETGCPGYSSPVLILDGSGSYLYMAGTRMHGEDGRCEIRYGIGMLPSSHSE